MAKKTVSKDSGVKNILIGVPVYKEGHPNFIESINKLLNRQTKHTYKTFFIVGDSLIDRARATILAAFLNWKHIDELKEFDNFDYLLQIDSDISFDWEDVDRFVDEAVNNQYDIYGGCYAFKTEKRASPVLRLLDSGESGIATATAQEVKYQGTGWLMMSAKAINDVCKANEELSYYTNVDTFPGFRFKTYAVYQPLPVPQWGTDKDGNPMREYLSEDYALCHRLRSIGYKIMVDKVIKTTHWKGTVGYQLPRG